MSNVSKNAQAWELSDLAIHKLLSLSRKVSRDGTTRSVRLAVLGDCASQHYCQTLGAILKLRGWWPEIYEAEFDTLHQEILDPESGLYRHKPQFVVFLTCSQAASARFASSEKKDDFADTYLTELESLWEALSSHHPCRIVQHLLATPLDRPYGNQSLAQSDTLPRAIARINHGLIEAAERKRILLVDTDYQASLFGKNQWFDERLWCQAKQALSPKFLPALTKSTTDTILAEMGAVTKCVVVDLDNTLWGGILADCGIDGIEIGHTEVGLAFTRFQQYLAELKRRGILLAICSKNNLAPVMSVLDSHPEMALRSDDFAAIVANYDDKASNICTIQEKLNIGFDSFVFLDDSKFERDLVRSTLPAVQVPELPEDPAGYLGAIAAWNMFEGGVTTAEDRKRKSF
jgi:HAD superfamily phosphatase (TIGR01681 family)